LFAISGQKAWVLLAALLAVHGCLDIKHAHGVLCECAIFVLIGETMQRLSQKKSIGLVESVPACEVKWLVIRNFLPPSALEESPSTEESGGPLLTTQLSF
jgi:hypothetical protein